MKIQVRPSSRAPRKEGVANFGHFRGADNPEWRAGERESRKAAELNDNNSCRLNFKPLKFAHINDDAQSMDVAQHKIKSSV